MTQHTTPKAMFDIPSMPHITIHVYGKAQASNYKEQLEQGYYVALHGKPVARKTLTDKEKEAVQKFLLEHYPQHAEI